jgi:MoaA/NifB/PqqE/SkfB family radical SAM enzyme
MCNLWRDPHKHTLGLDIFKSVIHDLNSLGCCYISLSGGEPLLIPDILSYIDFAKKKILFVNLVSNGYLLGEDIARNLGRIGLDSLSISIDGLEKKHDEIRGVRGSFLKAMEAIHNVKRLAPQVKITVNTVISPWNIDEIIDLAKLVEKLGVLHKLQPIYRHPVFENQNNFGTDWQMDEERIRKLEEIVEYLKKKKNVSNSRYYLSGIPDYFLGKNKSGLFDEKCKSTHFYCEIREDGKLYPCIEGMRWQGGFDLFKNSLRQVYYSPNYKNAAKKLQECRRCQEILPICYIESRAIFPISSYIKYTLIPTLFAKLKI